MRLINADDAMERIEQAYKDMGVDTHGIWNKQLAEIFKSADVEDIRLCLHKILGAVAQSPTINRPQGHYIKGENGEWYCSNCKRIDDKYSVARFCWWCGARMEGVSNGEDIQSEAEQ